MSALARRRIADLRGIVQLAGLAVAEVAGIAEGVHRSVLGTVGMPGPAPGRVGGITGLAYAAVRTLSRGAGGAADGALAAVQAVLPSDARVAPVSRRREALVAVLNGVMGDRLAAAGNPLATPMRLRCGELLLDGRSLPALPDVGDKLLVLVHGLCLDDGHWQARHAGQCVDHGRTLAQALGYTPLYLRYNSGLHVADNGRALSALLEQLLAHWPVPVQQVVLLGHSLGGLVARSAVHHAQEQQAHWPARLRAMVFLGTPHHGAPLERAGSRLHALLGSTPWSAPLARLGGLRSAGITDLRFGHVLDSHRHDGDRYTARHDRRTPVPLPVGVACHTYAATRSARRSVLADRVVGDGLVPLRSALGQHEDAARDLGFAAHARCIGWGMGHMELLSRPEVGRQLVRWLGPTAGADAPPAAHGARLGVRARRAAVAGRGQPDPSTGETIMSKGLDQKKKQKKKPAKSLLEKRAAKHEKKQQKK